MVCHAVVLIPPTPAVNLVAVSSKDLNNKGHLPWSRPFVPLFFESFLVKLSFISWFESIFCGHVANIRNFVIEDIQEFFYVRQRRSHFGPIGFIIVPMLCIASKVIFFFSRDTMITRFFIAGLSGELTIYNTLQKNNLV